MIGSSHTPGSAPGLYLHQGNSLTEQAALLAEIMAAHPLPPLRPEQVVVQSLGMARWLTLQLAGHLGVCAQVRFPFPRKYFETLSQLVSPAEEAEAVRQSWQETGMTWAIMDELLGGLDEDTPDPELEAVQGYLQARSGERTLRAYQLSAQIAKLFDQYLTYRPAMMREWSDATETAALIQPAAWQRTLWRRLKARHPGAADPVERRDALLRALSAPGLAGLPPRAFFFGITTLPPFYLELLPALAAHMPVHLFLPQPTREFWADLASGHEQSRRRRSASRRGEGAPAYLEEGHSLLASWGTQGKEFQQLVLDALAEADAGLGVEHFIDPLENLEAPPTILRVLQSDVLNLRARGGVGEAQAGPFGGETAPRLEVVAGDRSLAVHACGGPLREVEVLHDQLLAAFEEIPGLEPKDIIVMAPEIGAYAPHIETVFGAIGLGEPALEPTEGDSRPRARERIPYNVADRSPTEANQIARVILRLFQMARPGERFTATDVLDLLEMPALRRGQGLDETALERIRAWVQELPVHWGKDAEHRGELGLPADPGQTWREAQERLLLGYATGLQGRLLAETAPFSRLGSEDAEVLGRFCTLLNEVFNQTRLLARPASLAQWSERLLNLLAGLFPASLAGSEGDVRLLREVFTELPVSAGELGGERRLPTRVMEAHLTQVLQLERHAYGFIAGGVTFCTLKPMRSIPFRVICLLGMNDRAFPRQDQHIGFDLMGGRNRKPGDRSRREEDRYLFLEALLAARERLLILYSSVLPREPHQADPCPLVIELLEHLEEVCTLSGSEAGGSGAMRERFLREHPLHAFDPGYFRDKPGNALFSFSEANLAAAIRKAQGAGPYQKPDFLGGALEPDEDLENGTADGGRISLDELVRMLKDPCRYFLEKRMELALGKDWGLVADSERFSLDGLEFYKLRDRLFHEFGEGDSRRIEHLYRLAKAEGLLPPGQAGRVAFSRACAEVRLLREAGRTIPLTPLSRPMAGAIRLGGVTVDARLRDVFQERMVTLSTGRLKPEAELEFWLKHLALDQLNSGEHIAFEDSFLLGVEKESNLSSKKGLAGKMSRIVGRALPHTQALNSLPHLQKLLELRAEALNAPLHFQPGPALVFAESLAQKGDLELAQEAASRFMSQGKSPWKYGRQGSSPPDTRSAWLETCFPKGLPLDQDFVEISREVWAPYLALRKEADAFSSGSGAKGSLAAG